MRHAVQAGILFFLLTVFLPGVLNAQEIHYLSGTGKDDMLEWEFYCSEGRNSGKWTAIGVPSCWELQGFGNYNYGLDAPEDRAGEYGLYRHRFPVPREWKDQEVKIVFEGVMTDAEVRVNGCLAGEVHRGAFYRFTYSITDLLKYGKENLLEVRVDKISSDESVNRAERNADFWIFGGIFRPVYLRVLPSEHISRVAVDAQASGDIRADIYLDAPSAERVALRLLDLEGNTLQEMEPGSLVKEGTKWSLTARAEHVETWNPEKPVLYQLGIAILDRKGEVLHEHRERIGFRTVEVLEGDGIYVNGERIRFKGVNRHSFYPESGRTTSKALSIEHVLMMKDMNMNAVRMSHYPPDVHFLDACDSLGLFVIDEVCTWQKPALATPVGRKIIRETVIRDVNHPSVLLWANGNEGGWNRELDDEYARWDIQQREVIHPWGIFRKTNTLHYMHYHGLVNDAGARDRIQFPTEFLHGLYDGGHGAGLEDYWNVMWNNPLGAGGFLWVFADEAVVRTDRGGILDSDGNHAPDGIVGPFGEKEASYYTIKEIWSPVHMEDRYITDDFNGIFRIENRYHFTRLGECSMKAKWIRFNSPGGSSEPELFAEEQIKLPDLAPGEKGLFRLEIPAGMEDADALHLCARDPSGREIFTWSYPLKSPQKLNAAFRESGSKGEVLHEMLDGQYRVQAGEMEFLFSASTGMLEEARKRGRVIPLNGGPLILGQKVEVDSLYWITGKQSASLVVESGSEGTIIWTVNPSGTLDLRVEMKGEKQVSYCKGISFTFPESEVRGMQWLGDGPYRVWRNRMKGTRFQVWENDYNNTVTGESGYVYPEFKGFFSSLYWARVLGRNDNGFTVYCHSPHTYLRMLTPENPGGDANGRVSLDFPAGDISFVKNIPPIGTKFQEPGTMGPRSNPVNYLGNNDDPLVIELTFVF